ncbi:histidine kinase [Streptomyces sp. NPDC001137]|uniref:ATP-binding protein n=1 Tax=Streptomyces sp. NPDC001137 TaxID=3154378 RepID=UPI003323D734
MAIAATEGQRRLDALRALALVLGVLGTLVGLLGPVWAGAPDATSLVGVVSGAGACVLGVVILDRRPANRSAWGFLAGGLLLVATTAVYSVAAGQTRAGAMSPADASTVADLAVVGEVLGALAGASLPLFQLFYPDGRLPSPRWRPVLVLYLLGWVAGAIAVGVVAWPRRDPGLLADLGDVDLTVPGSLDPALQVIAATEGFAVLALAMGVAAMAVRLRRTRGNERAQVLLGLWGIGTTAFLIAATAVLFQLGLDAASTVASLIAPLPLLVSVAVAMRRHRLFDVQRLVGQTLTYATVTVLLVGLYAAVAVGLGSLADHIGLGSGVPVAAATLATAAAFRPLLGLVRTAVDRRFDRRTWLAVRTIDEFTARLRAGTAEPADLVEALRRAVDDPTACVVYLDSAHATGEVDSCPVTIGLDGAPADLGEPRPGRMRRTVEAGGAPVALIDLDSRLTDEPHLVQAALTAASLPLENAALHARAAVRLAEVAASRSRIVAADDSDRRRIERDLHDGPQQRLVALALRLRMAQRQPAAGDRAAADVLGDAVAELRATVDELRELTRGILPPVLTDEGLAVALRTAAARLPIPVTLDVSPQRLAPGLEATVWFVACEGMTNAVKHAGAQTVSVQVRSDAATVRLLVRDDGVGGAVIAPGGGLQGLTDRVAAVGGRLRIHSPSGSGTTLEAELPCAS